MGIIFDIITPASATHTTPVGMIVAGICVGIAVLAFVFAPVLFK